MFLPFATDDLYAQPCPELHRPRKSIQAAVVLLSFHCLKGTEYRKLSDLSLTSLRIANMSARVGFSLTFESHLINTERVSRPKA
jgi:hypothetical protein